MRNARCYLVGTAVALAIACSDSQTDEALRSADAEARWEEAAPMIDAELEQVREADAERFPCDLFAADELALIVGAPLGAGAYAFVQRSEDDDEWKSPSCSWLGPDDDGAEVSLWVSRPEHFTGGATVCRPLVGYGIRQLPPSLGSAATWGFGENVERARGTLRVCSPQALLEVVVDVPAPSDEDRVLTAASTIAEKALAGPGSG